MDAANNYSLVAGYSTYLAVSIGLTLWVGQTLKRNGVAFLHETFLGKDHLAESVNHLLVVGFYLINIGDVALELRERGTVSNLQQVFEAVSAKLGVVFLVVGAMHFFNVYLFNRIRSAGELRNAPPPVSPQGMRKVFSAARGA